MTFRLRLLPAVIFCAAFALTLKIGAIWQGLDGVLAPTQAAAEDKPAAPAGKPADTKAGGPNAGSAKPADPTAPDKATTAAGKEAKSREGGKAGATEGEDGKSGRGERTGKPHAWFDPSQVTDSELDVLQKLSDRRTQLDKRQHEVETRERLLQATEKRIDAKIAELKGIQKTVDDLLKKHDKQKEEQLRSVVKIYENMKPKDAARIFEQLDMSILLDVVERMREAKVAPVLANMTPAKAKAVTAAMAQRRALPKPQANASK